jgi:hypothetical protein
MRYGVITEEQFARMNTRAKGAAGAILPCAAPTACAGMTTHRSSSYKGYRSKLEYNWAGYLDGLKAANLIDGWLYEPMNFRLPGAKNFYKIDFQSWTDRAVTFYEVKGRNKSDERSLVKIKTAAGLHPWATFVLVKRTHGQWEERVIT